MPGHGFYVLVLWKNDQTAYPLGTLLLLTLPYPQDKNKTLHDFEVRVLLGKTILGSKVENKLCLKVTRTLKKKKTLWKA